MLISSRVSVRDSELQNAQRDSPLHERLQNKEAARRAVVRRLVGEVVCRSGSEHWKRVQVAQPPRFILQGGGWRNQTDRFFVHPDGRFSGDRERTGDSCACSFVLLAVNRQATRPPYMDVSRSGGDELGGAEVGFDDARCGHCFCSKGLSSSALKEKNGALSWSGRLARSAAS